MILPGSTDPSLSTIAVREPMESRLSRFPKGQDVTRLVVFGNADNCSFGTTLLHRTKFDLWLPGGKGFVVDGVQMDVPVDQRGWFELGKAAGGRSVIWLEGRKSVIFPDCTFAPGMRGWFVVPDVVQEAACFLVASFTPWDEGGQLFEALPGFGYDRRWKKSTVKRNGISMEALDLLLKHEVLMWKTTDRIGWVTKPRKAWEAMVRSFPSVVRFEEDLHPEVMSWDVDPFPWAVEISARAAGLKKFCVFLTWNEFRAINGGDPCMFRRRKTKFQVFADSQDGFEKLLGWKPSLDSILRVGENGGAKGSLVVVATLNLQKKDKEGGSEPPPSHDSRAQAGLRGVDGDRAAGETDGGLPSRLPAFR